MQQDMVLGKAGDTVQVIRLNLYTVRGGDRCVHIYTD